ncbi:MAG TPA: helix-turn-helix domain-containing protein, partial [Chloroflexota bacterium]
MSVASKLPGYASVARASEVLRLAPRSVRDLIYTGRLPSQRIGRLHYIHATDLEVERRRRLGLP